MADRKSSELRSAVDIRIIRSKLRSCVTESASFVYILKPEGRHRSARKSSHTLSSFGWRIHRLAQIRGSCPERESVSVFSRGPATLHFSFEEIPFSNPRLQSRCDIIWIDMATARDSSCRQSCSQEICDLLSLHSFGLSMVHPIKCCRNNR